MKRNLVKILIILLILSNFFYFAGCDIKQVESDKQKIKVAVTIYPLYDLTKEVASGLIETVLVVSPGVSPHFYEPQPEDIKNLYGVKAIISTGLDVDSWVLKLAQKLNEGSKTPVLNFFVNKNIKLLKEDGEQARNPHIWLSLVNAIEIVKNIQEILTALYPEGKDEFLKNSLALLEKIKETNTFYKEKFDRIPSLNKKFISFHDAYSYIARDYGLTQVAVIEETPGREPTPKFLAELETLIKKEKVKAVFLEAQLYSKLAEVFFQELNIKTYMLDPLGGMDKRKTYLDMIKYNLDTILEAFIK